MSIGEAIGKGLELAKKSLGLILVVFVFGFAFNLLNIFLAPAEGADANQPPQPALIIAGVVFILLTIFFQAGSMAYIRDRIKTGSANLSNFTAGGAKYYVRLLLLGLVVSLVIGVCVLLAAFSAAALQNSVPALSVPLAILFAALGIYFVVMFFLAPYAAVVDEQGVKPSIKTSMRLVKKNIGRLLGISVLMILIGFGIGLILGALLAGVSALIKAEMATQIIFALLSSLVNSFLGIFVTGAFMVFYLSLPDRNNS